MAQDVITPLNHNHTQEKSIPQLMRDLAEETTTLTRQELDLFKAEMLEKAKTGAPAGGMIGGAVLLALMALGAVTACFIAALALAMPVWAAALIVSAVYIAIAAALGMTARERLQRTSPTPDQTVQTVKEDIQWAKTQAKSGRT